MPARNKSFHPNLAFCDLEQTLYPVCLYSYLVILKVLVKRKPIVVETFKTHFGLHFKKFALCFSSSKTLYVYKKQNYQIRVQKTANDVSN